MSADELVRFVKGGRVKFVPGLTLGEVCLLQTKGGVWMEGREAIRKGLGGEMIARVG